MDIFLCSTFLLEHTKSFIKHASSNHSLKDFFLCLSTFYLTGDLRLHFALLHMVTCLTSKLNM